MSLFITPPCPHVAAIVCLSVCIPLIDPPSASLTKLQYYGYGILDVITRPLNPTEIPLRIISNL